MQRIIVDVFVRPSIAANEPESIPAIIESTVVDAESLPLSDASTVAAIWGFTARTSKSSSMVSGAALTTQLRPTFRACCCADSEGSITVI